MQLLKININALDDSKVILQQVNTARGEFVSIDTLSRNKKMKNENNNFS